MMESACTLEKSTNPFRNFETINTHKKINSNITVKSPKIISSAETISPKRIISNEMKSQVMTETLPVITPSVIRPPLPLTFKSVTSPSFPSYKPQEQTFAKPKNVNLITAIELGKILIEYKVDDYIILDIRSFSEYSKSAIKNSFHVCLPSTLLRRKNFTFEKLVESLPFTEQQIMLNKFKNPNLRIYLYDNSIHQTDTSISQGCHGILVKLLNYSPCQNPDNNIKIGVLSCGFSQFRNIFPEDTTNNNENKPFCDPIQTKLEDSISVESYHGPSILDNINLRLNVTDTSTASSYLNSPSPPQITTESPLSSSSPISALVKFQLPSQKAMPSPLFKFPHNEEIMNIESYISAVNINEKQTRIQEKKEKKNYRNSLNLEREKFENEDNENNTNSLTSFQFPKRSTSSCSNLSNDEKYKDKLTVQIKYSKLHSRYCQRDIDKFIPKWFQELMSRTKIQFASQFQKLDILEKRRLNSSISSMGTHSGKSSIVFSSEDIPTALPSFSKPNSHSGSSCNSSILHKSTNSETSIGLSIPTQLSASPFSFKSPPAPLFSKPGAYKQTRSYSQPDCLTSGNQKWMNDIDTDLKTAENDLEKIVISSGVELGSKNRYKDIFPYEHTRVRLKKHSLSSVSSSHFRYFDNLLDKEIVDEKNKDITDTYINANYLDLPELENSQDLLSDARKSNQTILPSVSEKVRYIATQAPLRSTVHDFYSCVINDEVPLILSLTNDYENGIEKCFQYWKPNDYDGITVKIIEEIDPPDLNQNVTLRRIRLSYDNNTKHYDVIQYQIKNWLDLSTLSDPIEIVHSICFKNTLVKELYQQKLIKADFVPTILVHCSAGCGRTGTWCTIDSILSNIENFDLFLYKFKEKYLETEKQYDPVAWTINIFRKQRISMVQNINQFLFIYDCLLYYFEFELRENSYIRFERVTNSLSSINSDIKKTGIIKNFIGSKVNGTSG